MDYHQDRGAAGDQLAPGRVEAEVLRGAHLVPVDVGQGDGLPPTHPMRLAAHHPLWNDGLRLFDEVETALVPLTMRAD